MPMTAESTKAQSSSTASVAAVSEIQVTSMGASASVNGPDCASRHHRSPAVGGREGLSADVGGTWSVGSDPCRMIP
ncbi:hypothetical protein GCM10027061_26470 [Nesterenkonia suensis]